MYRGFSIGELPPSWTAAFITVENGANRADVDEALDRFIAANGVIDAEALGKHWFPNVEADIFVSHSHNDQEMALAFAAYVKTAFGLRCFVDSTIWKSADRLLRLIDARHCQDKETKLYDYGQRNLSTSHVHMMLVMAIAQMIDKCEAVFFLSTPDSISAEGTTKKGETSSPWIFAEITLSKLANGREPDRDFYRPSLEALGASSIQLRQPIDLTHFTDLTPIMLRSWKRAFDDGTHSHGLDALYSIS